MKTIQVTGSQKTNMILRLPDASAREIVNLGGGVFVPKWRWKEQSKAAPPPEGEEKPKRKPRKKRGIKSA